MHVFVFFFSLSKNIQYIGNHILVTLTILLFQLVFFNKCMNMIDKFLYCGIENEIEECAIILSDSLTNDGMHLNFTLYC